MGASKGFGCIWAGDALAGSEVSFPWCVSQRAQHPRRKPSSSAEQPCETQQFWFERGPMKIFLVSVFLDDPSL